MANRPVFITTNDEALWKEELVEFQFFSGFSASQKQKSIKSLHESFLKEHNSLKVLEISTKSPDEIGAKLSAFNLKLKHNGEILSLESVFQGSKVFELGGPYEELCFKDPWDVKKDPRLKESGNIVGFKFNGKSFPKEPKTFYYDWLYTHAVYNDKSLRDSIANYDAFTDIEFNPKKSLNCQARTAAIYVSLYRMGMLEEALKSLTKFKELVYMVNKADIKEKKNEEKGITVQLNMFD